MASLNLTPEELLTTTRTVRKRLDLTRPVPVDLIRECLEIAIQAPTGGNTQGWHFIVVTDAAKRARLAELYRKAWAWYETTLPKSYPQGGSDKGPTQKIQDSAAYLAQHLHEVPVHLIPCLEVRPAIDGPIPAFSRGGSLFPAVWSFMLAARLRGLGTAWTTLHLRHEREAAEMLGIPFDKVSQGCLIAVAYSQGTNFNKARRAPLDTVLHLNGWT
jgi:nitroreductase